MPNIMLSRIRRLIFRGESAIQIPPEDSQQELIADDHVDPQHDESGDIVGYIEGLGPCETSGWAVSKSHGPVELVLECDGSSFYPSVSRHERDDVSQSLGGGYENAGFVARYPVALRRMVRADAGVLDRIKVYVSDRQLPLVADARINRPLPSDIVLPMLPDHPASASCAASAKSTERIDIVVEHVDGFILYGSVRPHGACGKRIKLLCNGKELESAVVCADDPASQRAGGKTTQPGEASTFEVELPGYIWRNTDDEGICSIQLAIGEDQVPPEGVRITREHAASWLRDIAGGYFGAAQYWELLGLEHLHFLGPSLDLAPDAAEFFGDKAALYGLERYVDIETSPGDSGSDLSQQIDAEKVMVWQALREFNQALPEWVGREGQLLQKIFSAGDLPQDQWHWVVYSLVPFFCKLDKFAVVQGALSASQVEALAEGADEWRVSLALPFLIEAGDIDRAADLLWRLPKTNRLWLNTECVAYLSRHVAASDPRQKDEKVAEKVAYGIVNLLDHLRPNFWSRLHDVQLIDALTYWLETGARWNTWLRRSLEAAAIRIYGLCPAFWERVDESLRRQCGLFPRLEAAQAHFHNVRMILTSGASTAEEVASVRVALAFFRRFDNLEVAVVAREHLCSRLSASDAEGGKNIMPVDAELLAEFGDAEVVRLASFPMLAEGECLEGPEALSETLMEMSEVSSRAPKQRLQRDASGDLRVLRNALTEEDDGATQEAITRLRFATAELCEKASLYIGLDLFASACLLIQQSGRPVNEDVAWLLGKCRDAIGLLGHSDWPPASLLGALVKLGTLVAESGDIAANALLSESLFQLEKRYAAQYKTIATAIGPVTAPSWPCKISDDNGDTLVVIYSCRKYLDSRIPAIRTTWVEDLKARGIPYVILVGDGDDSVDGDVLGLDVSDRYEDLPRKSLKLFEWVRTRTDFQYVIKVDDDCYLDVERFFDSLSHRKFHYYGRALHRKVGVMDRVWHQGKAQGERARRALDKSPEPSVYADGGTGYCLSRLALECLHEAASSHDGERLIASSFMEDKLIGDLLHRAGVHCEDEDYYTYVRRRTFGAAKPISMWVNTFAPSACTPTKLVHLDTETDMESTHRQRRDRGLAPKRIWPTHEGPSLTFNKNQLELLSSTEGALELLQEPLVVIAVVRNEKLMLPHFLGHYRQLGVKAFIFIDNASDDGTREQLLGEPDVVLYSADTEYRHSHYGVSWQLSVLGNHCVGKWALLADADELLVYPGYEDRPLIDYVRVLEQSGYDSARVMMIDMYPYGDLADGDFEKASPFEAASYFDADPVIEWRIGGGYYGNTRNFTSALRHRLIPTAEPHAFMSQKYALLRYMPWMRLNQGLHNVGNIRPADGDLCFAHFKYHAGFKRKVEIEVQRKQHFDGAREYKRYLEMVAEGGGGFGRDDLSVRYEGSDSFARALQANQAGEMS